MAANKVNCSDLKTLCIVSYNMHGFNQGYTTVQELIESKSPDIFMIQEHWLTPCNLNKFNELFPNYSGFGSSALASRIESGPLMGRPYGGTMVLIKNELLSVCECVHTADRFVVIRVGNILLINVYLPCTGTTDRENIIDDMLADLCAWRTKYEHCKCMIGGDFNSDLDRNCNASLSIRKFCADNDLQRCDLLHPCSVPYTFNNAQGHCSKIDYMLHDNVIVESFDIIESNTNLSDHLPLVVVCQCNISIKSTAFDTTRCDKPTVERLRWDHADTVGYYNCTRINLQSIFDELQRFEVSSCYSDDSEKFIESTYEKIICTLQSSASQFVPAHKVGFYKFWWTQELSCLKEKAIESDKLWKASGRPRSGPIFNKRRADKCAYKAGVRRNQSESADVYSNELHDALLAKRGNEFWKCWNSKFNKRVVSCRQVDGLADNHQIADKFKEHFIKLSSGAILADAEIKMQTSYNNMRPNYIGSSYLETHRFDAELIEKVIAGMKRGKAAGLDGITAEHLQHCHPLLPSVLAKLFNLIMVHGYVPTGFGLSFTVPLQKDNIRGSKSLTVEDFRGISISPVLSKIFEHCVVDRFCSYFGTSDNQFGFKKSMGCSHAIYSARCIINHYVAGGSTVNLCALDISKAFDRMSHVGLYIKLMKRLVPTELLVVIENWFSKCFTCVNFMSALSSFFQLKCGVRQGGVLSPHFFALFIDEVVNSVKSLGIGCYMRHMCMSIILYADDILLLAPSIGCLQQLFLICEAELNSIGMLINENKTVCMRIGPRYQAVCANIVTLTGKKLEWVEKLRYLGIYVISSCKFKCCFDDAKKAFFRSFNAVYGRIGRAASEEVILSLIRAKCLPVLLYGTDVCPLNASDSRSINFTVTRILMKIFRTCSNDIISECSDFFGFLSATELIKRRKIRFLQKYLAVDNYLCLLCASEAQNELDSLVK